MRIGQNLRWPGAVIASIVVLTAGYIVWPNRALADIVTSTIPVGNDPEGVAVDSLNGDIYVANTGDDTVSVINGQTNSVVLPSPISLGSTPGADAIAVDVDNGDIYVANINSNTVSVINGSTNAVIGNPIPVGMNPDAIAVDAANGDIYVTNNSDNTVSVINGSTNTVGYPIPVGLSPDGIAVDAVNGDIYVTSGAEGLVSVINGSTNANMTGIPVGMNPEGIAVDTANGDIYVANNADGTVSVINGHTNTVTSTITVGTNPEGVAADAANGDIYVANSGNNTVSVINGQTNTVLLNPISVGNDPDAVAVDAANGDIYVTNVNDGTVSVINTLAPVVTISSVSPGSTAGTSEVTATPNTAGDTFAVKVGSTVPSVFDGESLPSGATPYVSGTNIATVAVGDVLTIYEINPAGYVDAATSFTLTASDIHGGTVAYNGNGSTGGTAPSDSNQYMVGQSVTLAGQGSLTKTGYTFSGWNTKADGTGIHYPANGTLPMGNANITLYAQWTVIPLTSAPTGLQHTNVTQTGWIESFNPVNGATGYDVYLNGTKVGSTAQSVYHYTFTQEQPGTTYQVQVASVNTVGQQSALSTADSVTTSVYGGPVPPYINTIFFTENAQVGTPYSAQLVATGGITPLRWRISNGALPTGLTLSSQGIISGTPVGLAGQYTFTVQVTDGDQLSATRQLTLTVDGPTSYPSVTTISLIPVTIGKLYEEILTATGGTVPYTWSITKGILPSGIAMNPQTGELTGTPTQSGLYSITVQATDVDGITATQTITLDVLQPYEREIVWNGTIQNVPAMVGIDGGTQTTYMPIWYVMHLLNEMGIVSTWNGHDWSMTTSSTPDFSNIQAGTGGTSIYLNGVLVQQANTRTQNDPSTGALTTFMPIWYVQQILNRVGLTSAWNGTTWAVTQVTK